MVGTVHIKYAGFLLKWLQLLYEGRKKKLLLLFFAFTLFMVCIHEHINQLEKSMGLSADFQLLSTWETQLQRAPKQGSPVLLHLSTGALWMKFHPKCNCSCSTTKWDSKCNLHIWLHDVFRLYALVEIYIVLDGLFFKLKCAANNVLTFECYFLYW